MADTFSKVQTPARPAAGLSAAAGDDSLMPLVEMLFFAYRDFTGEADAMLETYGLGRAHHRVLHFVNRYPGLRVANLLDVLKITKQSLGRVLRQLVEDGWIEQKPGPDDRRERLLTLTAAGRDLAGRLGTLQVRRVAQALREIESANPGHDPGQMRDAVQNFLFAMIAREERAGVTAIMGGAVDAPANKNGRPNREARK